MSLVGFNPRNHPQQKPKSFVDDRATTPEVFDPIHARFGFTVDAAASKENAKLKRYWTTDDDGLSQNWEGERVWCNPPYSCIRPWVEKALSQKKGLVVMLLPANRTEQAWWQDLIEPTRDDMSGNLRTEFVRGRIRFIAKGDNEIKPNARPPFGCVLVIFGARNL